MKTKKILFFAAMLIFIIALVVSIPGKANAQEAQMSEEFKKILNEDGKLVITESTTGEKSYLIYEYLNKFNPKDNTYCYILNSYNEDLTSCNITRMDNVEPYQMETYDIEIIYEEKYSEDFQQLTKDGNIEIPFSSIRGNEETIWTYVSNFSTEKVQFQINNMNKEEKSCTIQMLEKPSYLIVEQHAVKMVFKEKFSEEFQKILKDGKIEIKSRKPENAVEAEFFLQNYLNSINHDNYEFSSNGCNEEYTMGDIYLGKMGENGEYASEIHKVELSYSEVDKEKAALVKKVLSEVPETKQFVVTDLDVINYIANNEYKNDYGFSVEAETSYINYSREYKKLLGNTNITAKLDVRKGGAGIFIHENGGGYVLSYDDVAYDVFEGGAVRENVIYIPDSTEESKEAYIKAAQERINSYLKNDKMQITYAGKLSEFEYSDHDLLGFGNKIRDEYYTLKYNKEEFPFLIVKDSSKMQEDMGHTTKDILTNVSISTSSSTLPLDTKITAKEIIKEDEEYKKITEKLAVEDALVYDLVLYSNSKKQNISELKDGTFEVKIPLTKDWENKELMAYYINENDEVEEFEVENVEGFATFKTNHFSTYTLAEKAEEEKEPIIDTKPELDNNSDKEEEEEVKLPQAEDKENKGEKDDTPKTGNIDVINYIFVTAIIVSVAGIVVLKRKKS